jgi:hypothetical protein
MWAENRMRIPVCPLDDAIEIVLLNGQLDRHRTILLVAALIRKEKMFPAEASGEQTYYDSDCIVMAAP